MFSNIKICSVRVNLCQKLRLFNQQASNELESKSYMPLRDCFVVLDEYIDPDIYHG